jgi:hypothetical protein
MNHTVQLALDDLPSLNQCRLIVAEIDLKTDAIDLLDYRFNSGIDNSARMQIDLDGVADLEPPLWLLLWHRVIVRQDSGRSAAHSHPRGRVVLH